MIDKKLIKQTANNMLEKGSIEGSTIEYKKSFDIVQYQTILKTVCAFSNNFDKTIMVLFLLELKKKITKKPAIKRFQLNQSSEFLKLKLKQRLIS